MIEDAPEEESSDYSERPARRKKSKKTATRKRKKETKSVPDENSKSAYSITTYTNKVGIAGMEAFLRRPEFGVDIDAEFPPPRSSSAKTYYDDDGTQIGRGEAMAHRCQQLHQILINAQKAVRAEEASRQAEADRVIRGDRSNLPPEAMMPDSHQTLLARIDLQTIRDQASLEINAAYTNNQEPAAELAEPLLGSNNQPLISAAVQRLVYRVVHAQIRGNRLRALHVSETGDQRFQIPAEYEELRARLRYELQGALPLEQDVDRAATAQRLVVQEFPSQL